MLCVAHVGDVDAERVLDAVDIEEIAAVVRDHAIDEQHVCAELHQPARQVAADEPQPAGDQHAAAAIELAVPSVTDGPWTRGRGRARRAVAQVLAPDDERVPQLHHVDGRAIQPPEVEELRLAVGAVVVVHRHLGDAEAGVRDLLHHLQADDAAVLLEVHGVEDRAAHHAEVAVDVAHLQAEEQLDGVVIDAADDDAVQRIGAADLVAVDQIHVVVERGATATSISAGSYCASPSV